jgi:hypothetical protein
LIEPLAARVETEPLGEISEFGQRVQSMIDQFEKAKRHLNYAKHPLRGLEDWEKRLKVSMERMAILINLQLCRMINYYCISISS